MVNSSIGPLKSIYVMSSKLKFLYCPRLHLVIELDFLHMPLLLFVKPKNVAVNSTQLGPCRFFNLSLTDEVFVLGPDWEGRDFNRALGGGQQGRAGQPHSTKARKG